MKLQRKNRVSVDFNMASMTDLIFLLLVFFVLTSNFVTPSGMPVNLPSTKTEMPMQVQRTSVTITEDLKYYINDNTVTLEQLDVQLKNELSSYSGDKVVVLHVDESVPIKYFVKVAGIANSQGAKVSIATKQE